MKKVLFWLAYIPMGIVFLILGCFAGLFEWYDEAIQLFEAWCFDR